MARGRFKDLTGMKFGRLTVIERTENRGKEVMWLCKCDCGNECIVRARNLVNEITKSCGCLQKDSAKSLNYVNLVGKQFGRLIVIEPSGSDKHGNSLWKCKCDCGNISITSSHNLLSGQTKSCGCFMRDKTRETSLKLWQDEEHKQKMIKNFSGDNNPRYNPNLTNEERERERHINGYEEWKKQVKEQADYTCDCCGKCGGNMNSHHLNGYDWHKEGRTDINNGVCLCEKCHREFHHIYKYGNNTKEQYIEFKERKQKGDDK